MKKFLFVGLFAIFTSSLTFAATQGGNGNGGKNKIGGYIGWPIGLSYSHEFNDLVELDLVAAFGGYYHYYESRLAVHVGALFTVFDPVISGLGNQHCPLSVGPALGINLNFFSNTVIPGFSILCPVRWEINFADIPDFNLFIDVSPIGIEFNFLGGGYVGTHFTSRLGVGLRYRIPG
ncbi:MAG: hypothetical protein ACTTI6_08390 [Treponema sp.]|uniref:hypothetical protein n=1 Tax=Treponema sp. TaxID=166 RepID=UPI003FA2738D